jgi:hypothetical protein
MSDTREKYRELIHAELDKTASAEELAALQEYLATDPEARRERAELAQLTNLLDVVEPVETPAGLHTSIMGALTPQRTSLGSATRSGSRWRLKFPLIQYGYAMAAGLILGMVLTGATLWNLSPADKTSISGTLVDRENQPQPVATELMKIDVAELQGSVGLSETGSSAKIEFDLKSAEPVEVQVEFDGSQLGLGEFRQWPSTIRSLQAENGRISFRSNGIERSALVFAAEKNTPASLDIRFYSKGSLIHEAKVQIPGQLKK